MKQHTIRLAATGARVAAGAAVAAACAIGVVGAVAAPWPEIHTDPATTTVTPVPSDAVLVCNGSFRALGRDAAQAGLMVSAATMQLRVDGAADDTVSVELKTPDARGAEGAQVITGAVKDRKVPLFSAAESVRLSDADASGFAAAPCREPSLSSWLVGGDVSTGASDIILLSNPGAVTATVELAVYGDTRSASTVVVPAGTQFGVPLASVAAGSRVPVIQVSSSGAPVRASLQSTLVRGLDAVGIDLQDGVSGPQNNQVLLGVRSAPASEGDDTTGVVVRMLAPDQDAHTTLRVRAAGSAAVLDEYPVDLTAGTPTEVSLTALPEGAYDIEISSTAPIVAGAKQTARAGDQQDLAWSLPSPELATGSRTMFSVPTGAPATLYLRNAESEPVTVVVGGSGDGEGSRRTVELKPDGTAAVAVAAGGYVLEPDGRVNAALGMRGAGGSAAIASWPLWAGAAAQQPIVVRP